MSSLTVINYLTTYYSLHTQLPLSQRCRGKNYRTHYKQYGGRSLFSTFLSEPMCVQGCVDRQRMRCFSLAIWI